MKLKIGQQFEVVEVLTDGGYPSGVFKIGGWTMTNGEMFSSIAKCVPNGENANRSRNILSMSVIKEIKPVGRLIVTKIK